MARPYSSGQVQISLVSFGVSLYLATEAKSNISFPHISRSTGERVRHQKVLESAAASWTQTPGRRGRKGRNCEEIPSAPSPPCVQADSMAYIPATLDAAGICRAISRMFPNEYSWNYSLP